VVLENGEIRVLDADSGRRLFRWKASTLNSFSDNRCMLPLRHFVRLTRTEEGPR